MDILGKSQATLEQCQYWADSKDYIHPLMKALISAFYKSAEENGIKAEILIAQVAKETNYMKYTGVLRPNFCNTCGLKNTKGGSDYELGSHKRFEYWEDGIQAHADHLALYAGAPKFPRYSPDCASHPNTQYKDNGTTTDPRHFTYLYGKCKTVESLGGNWAPSKTYGDSIIEIANQIINTVVPTNEFEKLYNEEKEKRKQLENKLQDISDILNK